MNFYLCWPVSLSPSLYDVTHTFPRVSSSYRHLISHLVSVPLLWLVVSIPRIERSSSCPSSIPLNISRHRVVTHLSSMFTLKITISQDSGEIQWSGPNNTEKKNALTLSTIFLFFWMWRLMVLHILKVLFSIFLWLGSFGICSLCLHLHAHHTLVQEKKVKLEVCVVVKTKEFHGVSSECRACSTNGAQGASHSCPP